MKDALLDLCDYTEAWRERFTEVARQTLAADPEGWARPVTAGDAPVGHGSLAQTLVHVVLVEDDWMQVDIEGRDVDLEVEYGGQDWPDLDAVWTKGDEVRARFRAYVPRWAEPVTVNEGRWPTTVGEVLMHVLVHEIAHHGDLTTILSALHAPDWGYFWMRHRMTRAGHA